MTTAAIVVVVANSRIIEGATGGGGVCAERMTTVEHCWLRRLRDQDPAHRTEEKHTNQSRKPAQIEL